MDIFDRINYIIENEGITIAEFSRKIGVGDQTIRGMLDKRKSNPSFVVLNAICSSYTNYNARWILTGDGYPLYGKRVDSDHSIGEMSDNMSVYGSNHTYKLDKKSVDDLIRTNLTLAKSVRDQQRTIDEIKNILDDIKNKLQS